MTTPRKRTPRKTALRAVDKDERKPDEPKAPPKTIVEAATSGTERELLDAMRLRLAVALQNPTTSGRDLASISTKLLQIQDAISAIDSQEGGDAIGDAAATPDEPLDAGSL